MARSPFAGNHGLELGDVEIGSAERTTTSIFNTPDKLLAEWQSPRPCSPRSFLPSGEDSFSSNTCRSIFIPPNSSFVKIDRSFHRSMNRNSIEKPKRQDQVTTSQSPQPRPSSPPANNHTTTTNSTIHPHKSSNVSQILPFKNQTTHSRRHDSILSQAIDRHTHLPPPKPEKATDATQAKHTGRNQQPVSASRIRLTFFSLFVRLARQASLQGRNEAANLHPRLSGLGAGSGMT